MIINWCSLNHLYLLRTQSIRKTIPPHIPSNPVCDKNIYICLDGFLQAHVSHLSTQVVSCVICVRQKQQEDIRVSYVRPRLSEVVRNNPYGENLRRFNDRSSLNHVSILYFCGVCVIARMCWQYICRYWVIWWRYMRANAVTNKM